MKRFAAPIASVAALLIGLYTLVAAPDYYQIVENKRFEGATAWLRGLEDAEERVFASQGKYLTSVPEFTDRTDLNSRFSPEPISIMAGSPASWRVKLRRINSCPPVYGCYTLTFTSNPRALTCDNADCASDLVKSPMDERKVLTVGFLLILASGFWFFRAIRFVAQQLRSKDRSAVG
jgi:Tfp pilus assembly protein PilE